MDDPCDGGVTTKMRFWLQRSTNRATWGELGELRLTASRDPPWLGEPGIFAGCKKHNQHAQRACESFCVKRNPQTAFSQKQETLAMPRTRVIYLDCDWVRALLSCSMQVEARPSERNSRATCLTKDEEVCLPPGDREG